MAWPAHLLVDIVHVECVSDQKLLAILALNAARILLHDTVHSRQRSVSLFRRLMQEGLGMLDPSRMRFESRPLSLRVESKNVMNHLKLNK